MKCVLLSQREKTDQYGVQIDVMESTYIKYFSELGFVPIAVSNFCDDVSPYFMIPDLAGVILTGGGSVPAEYYSDVRVAEEVDRGRVEKELMQRALERRLPVLGICHGMQFLNGYLGGKVSKLDFPTGERKNGIDHPVIWEGQEIVVNNFHNDGIYKNDLADGLRSIAEDIEYGVVEAFTSTDMMLLGIQWHPERTFSDNRSREKTKGFVLDFLKEKLE